MKRQDDGENDANDLGDPELDVIPDRESREALRWIDLLFEVANEVIEEYPLKRRKRVNEGRIDILKAIFFQPGLRGR